MASQRSALEELQSRLRAAEERLRMAEIAGGIATFEHDFCDGRVDAERPLLEPARS